MKIKIFVRNKDGILRDIITIEKDLLEYIEEAREICGEGEKWAEYLEELYMKGIINDDITL